MRKLLGSACILAGGVLAWNLQRRERRRQSELRAGLLLALRRMEEEIRLTRLPMPRLLEAVGRECCGEAERFFTDTAGALRAGEPLGAVWRREALGLSLPERERMAFSALGSELKGDETSVRKAISLAILQLQNWTEDWEKNQAETEKRTSALCFSASALLVILLI